MENSIANQKETNKDSMFVSVEVRNRIVQVRELLENSKQDTTPSQGMKEALDEALGEAARLQDRMRELIKQIDIFINKCQVL